jgi:hypothetical protein
MGSSNNCGNNSSNSNNCGSSDSSSDNSSARNAKVGEANGRLVGWNIYRLTRCPPDTTSEQGQHIHDCIWHTMTGCGMSVVSPERSEVFAVLLLAVQEPLEGSLRRQKERGRERDAGQSNNDHRRMCERWMALCVHQQKERRRERDAGQSNNEHRRMCERVSV